MKNIKVLSLLTLLAFGQVYAVNPDLSFVFAVQAIDELNKSISSDNDDVLAVKLIATINDCIAFDVAQQKALDGAKNTYTYNGVPLDLAAIQAQDTALQATINALNHDIDKLDNNGMKTANKQKINNRQDSRNKAQAKLNANLAAIAANAAAMTTAQQAQAQIATLRAKNALALEQAIESYISSLGQAYVPAGASKIVISSKYDQNLPITPKEFTQLITTLNTAYSQFGSAVMITLNLANSAPMTINNVVTSINYMPLSSSSYTSWAMLGLKATVGVAAAITAGGIAYNLYQNKNWNDTSDAQTALSNAQTMTQSQLDAAYQTYENSLAPNATAMSEAAWAQANGFASSVYNSSSTSLQSANDWFATNFGA